MRAAAPLPFSFFLFQKCEKVDEWTEMMNALAASCAHARAYFSALIYPATVC